MLDMLRIASYYGISLYEFWDSTPNELIFIIEGKKSRILDEHNFILQSSYDNASLTSIGILDPKKFPKHPTYINNRKKDTKFIYISKDNQDSVMNELESLFIKGFGSSSDIEEVTIQM